MQSLDDGGVVNDCGIVSLMNSLPSLGKLIVSVRFGYEELKITADRRERGH
jgi:hypothetical protein